MLLKSLTPLLFTLTATTLYSLPTYAGSKDTSNHSAHAEKEIHWSYDGESSPENWGNIKEDFKTCKLGKTQSPINLKETLHAKLPPLKTNYKASPLTILNNGHTIQINYPAGSSFTVDGERFDLLQFHFHTPSEYAINGKRYDMEMHLVHKNTKGELGVIGVMIEEGEENSVAKSIWNKLPKTVTEPETFSDITINASDLLPKDTSYFRLMGSLTTPPCSENVHWHVLKTPIQFSKEQIDSFKSIFPMNARPLQEPNNRLIILDSE